MSITGKDSLIRDTEALLAATKEYNGVHKGGMAFKKQVELINLQLKDPTDSMLRQ